MVSPAAVAQQSRLQFPSVPAIKTFTQLVRYRFSIVETLAALDPLVLHNSYDDGSQLLEACNCHDGAAQAVYWNVYYLDVSVSC